MLFKIPTRVAKGTTIGYLRDVSTIFRRRCKNSYELLKRSGFPMGIIVKPKSLNIEFNKIYSSFNEIIKNHQNKNLPDLKHDYKQLLYCANYHHYTQS